MVTASQIETVFTRATGKEGIACDCDLLGTGTIDSLDVLRLVEELESEYSVSIDGRELTPENFKSMETIAALITRLKA